MFSYIESASLGASFLFFGGSGFSICKLDVRLLSSSSPDHFLNKDSIVQTFGPQFNHPWSSASGSAINMNKLYQDDSKLRPFRNVSVSGLSFSKDSSQLLASYQGDQIYAFPTLNDQQEVGASSCYGGHINHDTFLKQVSFFGRRDEYVVSGSDSGHLWIWNTAKGALLSNNFCDGEVSNNYRCCEVVNYLKADSRTCNGVIPHPFAPYLASYGIDSDAKVWGFLETDLEEAEEVTATEGKSAKIRLQHRREQFCELKMLPARLEDSKVIAKLFYL